MLRGEAPNAPITRTLGMTLVAVEEGTARYLLRARTELENPVGSLHGGVLCDLADAAMGTAVATTLADDESFTTIELRINFLRKVLSGTEVQAEGRVIQRGKSLCYAECDVRDGEGLVARTSSTCMVLKARG